jgi:hypothetical protein
MPQLVITVPSYALTFDKKLLRRILGQAGREIVNTARALIGRDASGRMYGSHQASGAGGPPATLSGTLARSLSYKAKGDRLTIKDGVFYAKFLEVGAQGGGGGKNSKSIGRSHKRGGAKGKPQTKRILAPRPFLSVAIENDFPSLQKRIGAALSKSIDLKALGR